MSFAVPSLPNELLRHIFTLAIVSFNDLPIVEHDRRRRQFLGTLLFLSRGFSLIARSTPEMWALILITSHHQWHSFVQTSLQLSRSRPLDIRIELDTGPCGGPLFAAFLHLSPHSHRWESLSVVCKEHRCPSIFAGIRSLVGQRGAPLNVASLRTLSLTYRLQTSTDGTVVPGVSSLRSLAETFRTASLTSFELQHADLPMFFDDFTLQREEMTQAMAPWLMLTVLSLTNFTASGVQTWFSFAALFPRLTALKLRHRRWPEPMDLDGEAVLPCLRHLYLYSVQLATKVFKKLRAPNLRMLILRGTRGEHDFIDGTKYLIKNRDEFPLLDTLSFISPWGPEKSGKQSAAIAPGFLRFLAELPGYFRHFILVSSNGWDEPLLDTLGVKSSFGWLCPSVGSLTLISERNEAPRPHERSTLPNIVRARLKQSKSKRRGNSVQAIRSLHLGVTGVREREMNLLRESIEYVFEGAPPLVVELQGLGCNFLEQVGDDWMD